MQPALKTSPVPDITTLLANPIWHALQSRHHSHAVGNDLACRYPAEMAPFGAMRITDKYSLKALHALLEPGERIWIRDHNNPELVELPVDLRFDCYQMIASSVGTVETKHSILPLGMQDSADMLALTEISFPEFFRKRSAEMGRYFGIRSASGQLISMCGERMMPGNTTELSGICTHPDFRGQGLAAMLITHILKLHAQEGITSWLHVNRDNDAAVKLYKRTGFEVYSEVFYTRLVRNA